MIRCGRCKRHPARCTCDADVLADLARAKAVFQLRAIEAVIRDSDGTATAALNEDLAVPKDCQARAESIAQMPPQQPLSPIKEGSK